jgi:hypothetical protein
MDAIFERPKPLHGFGPRKGLSGNTGSPPKRRAEELERKPGSRPRGAGNAPEFKIKIAGIVYLSIAA